MGYYDFLFNVGHGTSEVDGSYDPGATYNGIQEHIVVEKIVDKAIARLASVYKMNVHRDEQNYLDVDLKGNTYKYKFAVSAHINAGGGQRAEVFSPLTCSDLKLQMNILSDLAKLGLKNGGVKSREYYSGNTYTRTNGVAMSGLDYYKEIRDAKNLGIDLSIYEIGFIDSNDIDIILANIDKIANIFADRIAEYTGVKAAENKPADETSAGVMYRVVVNSFTERKNAEAQQEKLLKAGYDSFLDTYIENGITYLRVIAGSYSVRANADKVLKDIKSKGFDAFIAIYNNEAAAEKPAEVPAPAPTPSKRYLNLNPNLSKWNVYKTNVAPVIGNECGALNPKLYGGLSYEILAEPQKDVYTIQTENYGKVNIYAPRDNDSSITDYRVY